MSPRPKPRRARIAFIAATAIAVPAFAQPTTSQSHRVTSPDGKNMHPILAHGLQAMSIGFLIDEEQPMIWRGPMVTSALSQLLKRSGIVGRSAGAAEALALVAG